MSAPALPSTTAAARQLPVVALVGCPNTGKSTLFNRLTGLHQRVANFPGVTIEGRIGRANLGSRNCEVLDLPGTYSLAATAPDELIVVDALLGRLPGHPRPTVVVLVADAAQLARHLVLAAQVADLGLPLVVAANLCDEARRQGIAVALPELSQRLGVPVIPTVASTGEGLPALRAAIAAALEQPPTMRLPPWPAMVHEAADRLTVQVRQELGHQLAPAEARRWLFDARPLAARRLAWSAERCAAVLAAAREPIAQAGHHPLAVETQLLRREIENRLAGTVTRQAGAAAARSWTERLDAVLLHPVAGPLILVAVLYLVFRSIYSWAGPVMDLIDGLTGSLQGVVAPWLAAWPTLQDLVVTGIIGGVGGVVIFLPQICILFGFIALLESSGYLARAAFLLDRLLGWSGLNGRSLIPMLSSYACAIPGVMATRTIDDPRARLTTILVAPLMSCSARLPVYVLLIGAFVEPRYGATWAALTLLAMHGVGLAVALPVAWVANRLVLRTPRLPFLLELPSYRRPVWRDVLHLVASRGGAFLVRAGTIILALSIVIWALLRFPRPAEVEQTTRAAQVAELAAATALPAAQVADQLAEGTGETAAAWREQLDQRLAAAYLEQSYLARFGKTIQPLFAPAGYDWKITVGVLGSFPAREVIIATLGIIYGLGDAVDEETPALREQLHAERWAAGPRAGQPVFTVPVALSIMVFFALCMQCGATVATIAREATWRWAVATFVYMTGLAWVGAVLTYQLGTRLLGGG